MGRTRGQGEGSIWRRKDGRWEARLALGWENGKRQSKSYFGKTRAETQDKLGVPLPTAYVFTTINGGPIDATTLSYHFKRLLAKAGLPHFRIHDLRHSCASILLAAGVPPKVIQEMLGHSQISTTMNIYAHVMPNLKQEAADAMDAMFGGAGS